MNKDTLVKDIIYVLVRVGLVVLAILIGLMVGWAFFSRFVGFPF